MTKRYVIGILLVGTLAVCLPTSSIAQVSFSFGPRLGFNFASMSFDPDPTVQTPGLSKGGRFGVLFGGVADMEFAKMFEAELGILYTMKGASFDYPAAQASETVKFNELNIPILFKVKFLPGNKIRPYAFLGPNLGIVATAGATITQQGQTQDVDYKNPPAGTVQASSIDFALEFGGGVEFMLTRNIGLVGDVRYSLGLSNLVSAPNTQGIQVQQATSPTWHASGFQIYLGSNFHI